MGQHRFRLRAPVEFERRGHFAVAACEDGGGKQCRVGGACGADSKGGDMPLSARDCTGTPSTGSRVFAAVMPGRCAAPPAPAMSTSMPRPAAAEAYSNSRSGVRCAETTRTSWAMPSLSSNSPAGRRHSQSEAEPMMMPTSGFIGGF